ncbi:hypothetical protein H8356DRAFT_1278945 [Neocallimastix lanati (nom. inval.)]|jgi:hypothetical protein|uniref:Uncharacterized protein n=1 Tax=Neocallimastix californiae TaxID=1754190 RepID=A0A1Y2DME5_9FUNG|nr:hypothetical protein H8356DRAFT_1278945 [Neocallimastix sp. JGI-2020a]ORY60319.1 hypothetical protein LY90DRAFT_505840 [Neocallimastix californiae]|eukprot:ORY60319.1 hypothetical protein LY90DRAFT_505840 [Neocallimastix californiae]
MCKSLLLLILLLTLVKISFQACCFTVQIQGDGVSSYYVDVMLKPAAEDVTITYLQNYSVESTQCEQVQGENKLKCQGSVLKDYFQTRIVMKDPSNANINSIDMDVYSGDERCQRSFDVCNPDGTVKTENGDNYCFFFGCFPKMACYIGIGVFIVVIAGIALAVIRRNSGSGENAALDRPNTKKSHLNSIPNPISNPINGYSNTNNKETLIQIEEMPVDFKEAGTTNWVNKKYNSQPSNLNKDLGLGLGSGGFGSKGTLLPQTSNVTVLNDPSAGLNRGRSVKRAQSTRSSKKSRSNDPNHLNAPPLPNGNSPLYNSTSLGRTKSARSTKSVRSVKSSKSMRKQRGSESGGSALTPKKSIRNQPSQKRYHIPSDSESDSSSDSDNEVLGLRAKPSMKRTNGTGSLPRNKQGYHPSLKGTKSVKSSVSSPHHYR